MTLSPRPRQTKLQTVIDMLQRRQGATIAEIARVTQWQPHTIRGAISGGLKKRRGLEVTSQKVEGRGRIYSLPAANLLFKSKRAGSSLKSTSS